MKILSKKQILNLHEGLIYDTGGTPGLRDEGLFESAISSPFQTFDGHEIYSSIEQKAARLCFCLVKDHPFVDGNKRIGAHAMIVMLSLNGIELDCTQEELSDTILKLAAGKIDFVNLLKWVCEHEV